MQLTGTARQKPLKLFGPSVAPVVLFVLVPCVLVDSARLRIRYSFELALAAQVDFELCEHASISRKHLPAAVLVSIGCSVAFKAAPRYSR